MQFGGLSRKSLLAAAITMLLILLLLVAGATAQDIDLDIDPCKSAFDACEDAWVAASLEAASQEQRCTFAIDWESCLVEAAEVGSCEGNEDTPETLIQELSTYCDTTSYEDCNVRFEECRETWAADSANAAESELCDLAKQWRACEEDVILNGHCTDVSEELEEEEKNSCNEDTSGACGSSIDSCRALWAEKYSENQPNSVKCSLADEWTACFYGAARARECQNVLVEYPYDLAVQAAFCYISDIIDLCQEGQDECSTLYSDALSRATNQDDECVLAQAWSDCLSDSTLRENCLEGIRIPPEVTEALSGCYVSEAKESCTTLEENCAKEHQLPVDDLSNDRCQAARDWQQCLDEVKADGCDVIIPIALEDEEDKYCDEDVTCPAKIAECKADFDMSDPAANRCEQTDIWAKCLEDLIGVCDIATLPLELILIQAEACYAFDTECLTQQTECSNDHQDKVRMTGESCTLVTEWKDCLNALSTAECKPNIPVELYSLEADFCYLNPGSSACGDAQAACKTTYDNADPSGDRCQQALDWKDCLYALSDNCDVTYPVELAVAEADACYTPAELTCDEKAAQCETDYVTNSSKEPCEQADDWEICLDGLAEECGQTGLPVELGQMQATYCYGR